MNLTVVTLNAMLVMLFTISFFEKFLELTDKKNKPPYKKEMSDLRGICANCLRGFF